jgi:hypothetical protein
MRPEYHLLLRSQWGLWPNLALPGREANCMPVTESIVVTGAAGQIACATLIPGLIAGGKKHFRKIDAMRLMRLVNDFAPDDGE